MRRGQEAGADGAGAGGSEGARTQRYQVPVVLQHHVSVQGLLGAAEPGPLLRGESHRHVPKRHSALEGQTIPAQLVHRPLVTGAAVGNPVSPRFGGGNANPRPSQGEWLHVEVRNS